MRIIIEDKQLNLLRENNATDDKYKLGVEKNPAAECGYAHVVEENLDCEIDSGDVSLDSFKVQKSLPPKIFDKSGKMNSRVRLQLMDIADDFWKSTGVEWEKPKYTKVTGSICNYNYSEFSDVDLHIVVDFSKIGDRSDFVQKYFNDAKNLWNDTHDKLNIYGYPVELYVEDINAETEARGAYNLDKNEWIKKPRKKDVGGIGQNKSKIKDKTASIMTTIDDMVSTFEATKDEHKCLVCKNKAEKLSKKIKMLRTRSLKSDGEMGVGNIVYKVLRRTGYLDKLWDLQDDIYDKLNSLH